MKRRALLLSALLALASCAAKPSSIEVTPDQPVLGGRGGRVQAKATVKDKEGNVMPAQAVVYRSLNPTLFAVDDKGQMEALRSGSGKLLVQAGEVTKEVPVVVQIPKRVEIDPEAPVLMVGVRRAFKATVLNDQDQAMFGGGIRWASSDPSVASIDDKGTVKTVKEGEVTITAEAAGVKGTTKLTVKHERLQEDGTLSQ
ncbi:MAG: Ig-like domain-containing protein [Deltaproteobacteria bacterium]|nr:Ig-like domain-containing protein [Deltaproteobacteria bacterium]